MRDDALTPAAEPTPLAPRTLRVIHTPDWQEVVLPEPYVPGRLVMLMNPKMSLVRACAGGNVVALTDHLHELVREWNLTDADGVPLPVSPEGVGELDSDLLEAITGAWARQRALPKR